MNVPGGLQKFLMSLGPDAAGFLGSAAKGAGRVGKAAAQEGGRIASEYPKTSSAAGGLAGGGPRAALLGDEDEEEDPQGFSGY